MKKDGLKYDSLRWRNHPEECITGSMFCVNCWPKEKKYSHFVWQGLSLCKECFEPMRKWADTHPKDCFIHGIMPRCGDAYKSVWGEDPPED